METSEMFKDSIKEIDDVITKNINSHQENIVNMMLNHIKEILLNPMIADIVKKLDGRIEPELTKEIIETFATIIAHSQAKTISMVCDIIPAIMQKNHDEFINHEGMIRILRERLNIIEEKLKISDNSN